ncbi:arginine-tRNA-protein transferase 1 [Coprinopsis marcescibilis]|uniref:Arginyl-tRNA--protein transferase 1 n=1 Tax=Coprinopsis marcescibilis TaxID=230819 RepID=A0A5C3L9Z8_COPMA|nr:arginine-tRNA-protein transferase 1 [Coprinopsis marcescibilis]
MVQSIGYPYSAGSSTCGYCSPPGRRSDEETWWKSASMQAVRLSCEIYQKMIDRGWRRSGTYCYKPDLKKCCCPPYTIKLDVLKFKPGRSQRKLLHRFNRYVLRGAGEPDASTVEVKRPKGRENAPFDLLKSLHEVEHNFLQGAPAKHKFEVILEPSSFTPEKFELFCKYQKDIHKDDNNSVSGFKRFLVDSPLQEEAIPYTSTPPAHLPNNYGSYHQLYRIDGKLVAMAVLDILPQCVSSVYFVYDSLWEHYSMGKISALREASLAYEINKAGVSSMEYLYMGYYIHSCQKMRYKGEYSPSYLADPETYEWYPIEKCTSLLDKNRYACFSDPSHCIEGSWSPSNASSEPGLDPTLLGAIGVIQREPGGNWIAVPLPDTKYWKIKAVKQDFTDCIRSLGLDLAEDIFWTV